jgi:Pyridine nucleotide-disulphide oxidoreductase
VYIIHRRDAFRASKIMQARALANPKIEVLWDSVVEEAYGNEAGLLGGAKVRNVKTGEVRDVPMAGLFFAIGHEPATRFLDGQLELDGAGYIVTAPDSTATSVPGVFAAGDVQDPKWRQAITAAGTGAASSVLGHSHARQLGCLSASGDAQHSAVQRCRETLSDGVILLMLLLLLHEMPFRRLHGCPGGREIPGGGRGCRSRRACAEQWHARAR